MGAVKKPVAIKANAEKTRDVLDMLAPSWMFGDDLARSQKTVRPNAFNFAPKHFFSEADHKKRERETAFPLSYFFSPSDWPTYFCKGTKHRSTRQQLKL
ncbi:hypothetical protein [Roseobacter litoralis]|uniref:hypothetical protein n=1 Tax=Roseobacter litoralis TaxID=42443 RepID=UPI00248FA2F3|nr:hypothetical protein [Roseobacter litoralis]